MICYKDFYGFYKRAFSEQNFLLALIFNDESNDESGPLLV